MSKPIITRDCAVNRLLKVLWTDEEIFHPNADYIFFSENYSAMRIPNTSLWLVVDHNNTVIYPPSYNK